METAMLQRGLAVLVICSGSFSIAGCGSLDPERVFRNSTEAFAVGQINRAARHFSKRLAKARPVEMLERYYSDPSRRRGVAYLLEQLRFQLVEETDDWAIARVTWTTGLSETVHFVREEGEWKLDLPRSPDS